MKREFMPESAEGRMWHLVEEAAEVQKLCSKIFRFGHLNHHPDDKTETPNAAKLLDELQDLNIAMSLVQRDLKELLEIAKDAAS